MTEPVRHACSVLLNHELVVAGGGHFGSRRMDASSRQSVGEYDHTTNTWRSLPPMNEGRRAPVCGVVADSLVVAGGFQNDDAEPLATAEAYSPTAGQWASLPRMPHATSGTGPSACVLDGRLYVIGGGYKFVNRADKNYPVLIHDKGQVFDCAAWSVKDTLPAGLRLSAVAVRGAKLWTIGADFRDDAGQLSSDPWLDEGTTVMMEYNPRNVSWVRSEVPPPPGRQTIDGFRLTSVRACVHADETLMFRAGLPAMCLRDRDRRPWSILRAGFPNNTITGRMLVEKFDTSVSLLLG